MSPRDARRLVGHSDEVEALKHDIGRHIDTCSELETDNERLRGTLRAVRCSTDPEWAKRMITEALGE